VSIRHIDSLPIYRQLGDRWDAVGLEQEEKVASASDEGSEGGQVGEWRGCRPWLSQ